jgi:hypothetical protein
VPAVSVYPGSFSAFKLLDCEVKHAAVYTAEGKTEWSYLYLYLMLGQAQLYLFSLLDTHCVGPSFV